MVRVEIHDVAMILNLFQNGMVRLYAMVRVEIHYVILNLFQHSSTS